MIGTSVGNFLVMRKLGQGGMGEVLLAEHKDIKTKVAIKVLLPHISADKQHVQRFFNEAVAVSKIKHAGIAKIFDVGFLPGGEAYLVMEFLDGESLASRIGRAGRLPFEQVSDIARQIASVLEATHVEGITHRDLKPDNIFLVPDSELSSGERVKVLDFGIAKLGGTGMTQTGGAMGTPAYMSPEQWKSSASVDGRADLYSLGCLVFEMACGRPPFVAESIGELCTMHLGEEPPTARSIVPDLPPAFDALVTRLVAKRAGDRPTLREAKQAFAQFATEFRGVTAETMLPDGSMPQAKAWVTPASVRPTTLGASAGQAPTVLPPPVRKSKPIALIAAGVLVAGGIAVAMIVRGGGDETHAAQPTPPPPVVAAAVEQPIAPPPPAAPVPAMLRIETVPANARITIDDGAVANPFDGKFPRSELRRRIDVRADGYKPDSRWITLDTDHTLVITLERDVVATTKPAKKPASKPAAVVTTPPPAPVVEAKPAEAGKGTYKGSKATIITEYPPN